MHKASKSILILSAPRYELDFETREAASFGVGCEHVGDAV
jgi:hypothetical protein